MPQNLFHRLVSATCPLLAAVLLIPTASGEKKAPITVKDVPIAELGFPLPTPIALRGDQWKCQLSNISTKKTFGGAFPWLAVRYLGKGLFAFAETAPGETEEKSAEGFPQAYAITYLLDSKNDRILERSPAYLYDHNPPVKPEKEWFTKYELPPTSEED